MSLRAKKHINANRIKEKTNNIHTVDNMLHWCFTLLHTAHPPTSVCVSVCVCLCVHMCVWLCPPTSPDSRYWSNNPHWPVAPT